MTHFRVNLHETGGPIHEPPRAAKIVIHVRDMRWPWGEITISGTRSPHSLESRMSKWEDD
jgi:hypothetical protein